MKKSLYLLLGLLLVCSIYQACAPEDLPGSISGTVVDKATGEPIKDAGVTLTPNNGATTVTGSDGHFEFTDLTPNEYDVVITKTGYQDTTRTITVKSGANRPIDIQLEKLPPALKVVDDNRKEIDTLDFGSAIDDVARSFSLFNDGTESLEWQITVTADWIKSVSKIEGILSAGVPQSLIVTIDRTKLKSGENKTTLHITSNAGTKELIIIATSNLILVTLNTLEATNITAASAVLNGQIIIDGNPKYTERGFVYSDLPLPTIDCCIKKIVSMASYDKTYSATINNLTEGMTYYVRAYAINTLGIAYGEDISFVAKDGYNKYYFSSSATNRVIFSSGNLQYQASSNKWRFAPKQTDYIGDANSNISNTYDDWIDLFCWSSLSFGASISTNITDYIGEFIDWGTNKIGDDVPDTWRTPSREEWEYILNYRNNAPNLRGIAQVQGVNGLVLLPDNWRCPNDVTFKADISDEFCLETFAQHQSFTNNQWLKLEQSGAIFLPASGTREGCEVSNIQKVGGYMSSSGKVFSQYVSTGFDYVHGRPTGTMILTYLTYCLYFTSNSIDIIPYNTPTGCGVRLIKDI